MDDEELYKAFEPTQHTILGYVSDMWKSKNDFDEEFNVSIIPISVRNNDRWMPSSSTLVKRISKFFGDSIFAYKLTKSLPGLTRYSLLEFHVREASPNKGSKYSVDYDYEDMKRDNVAYPVATMDLKFIKPCVFNQKLRVVTSIEEIEPSLIMKYTIYDDETGEKLFKARSMQICINKTTNESIYSAPEGLKEKLACCNV